jgi:hypothetical protein
MISLGKVSSFANLMILKASQSPASSQSPLVSKGQTSLQHGEHGHPLQHLPQVLAEKLRQEGDGALLAKRPASHFCGLHFLARTEGNKVEINVNIS